MARSRPLLSGAYMAKYIRSGTNLSSLLELSIVTGK